VSLTFNIFRISTTAAALAVAFIVNFSPNFNIAGLNYVNAQEISNTGYDEIINNFRSIIIVQEDASLKVVEQITYDFGLNEKHGIYRDIPITYRTDINNFSVRLKVLSVTDENGVSYEYKVRKENNDVRIKIGDADVLISGEHTYIIIYTVNRAILFNSSGEAELYWNVTGDRWPAEIKKVEAQVFVPQGVVADNLKVACFTGKYGSETQNCSSAYDPETGIVFRLEGVTVLPEEGFTVVVRWPRGTLVEPGILQNILWFIGDNAILFLPILYIFIYGIYWWKRGRDPKGRSTIVPEYEAPDKLSPLEVGVIYDQSADKSDLGAGIIHFAIEGFLKIKLLEIKESGLFGFKQKKDWEFIRSAEFPRTPNGWETRLLDAIGILDPGSAPKKISDLKDGVFYEHISEIDDALYESLVLKGYFSRNPQKVRGISITAGIAPIVLLGFFIAFISENLNAVGVGAMFLSGLIAAVFGWLMPSRSLKGRLAYEHILGLKRYLSVAEKDRIKFHNPPTRTPELFEKFLPFAMVLRVEKEWAKQFESLTIPAPSWYQGGNMSAWNAIAFTSLMNNTVSDMNSTFSAPPPSSSGGGGGFSGGGFGGGGGGSW